MPQIVVSKKEWLKFTIFLQSAREEEILAWQMRLILSLCTTFREASARRAVWETQDELFVIKQ